MSNILEVGCGEGQNAIYLAGKGYLVDAFDLSEHGITKLIHRCKLQKMKKSKNCIQIGRYCSLNLMCLKMSIQTYRNICTHQIKLLLEE